MTRQYARKRFRDALVERSMQESRWPETEPPNRTTESTWYTYRLNASERGALSQYENLSSLESHASFLKINFAKDYFLKKLENILKNLKISL